MDLAPPTLCARCAHEIAHGSAVWGRPPVLTCDVAGKPDAGATAAIGYLLRVVASARGGCPFFAAADVPPDSYRAADLAPATPIEQVDGAAGHANESSRDEPGSS